MNEHFSKRALSILIGPYTSVIPFQVIGLWMGNLIFWVLVGLIWTAAVNTNSEPAKTNEVIRALTADQLNFWAYAWTFITSTTIALALILNKIVYGRLNPLSSDTEVITTHRFSGTKKGNLIEGHSYSTSNYWSERNGAREFTAIFFLVSCIVFYLFSDMSAYQLLTVPARISVLLSIITASAAAYFLFKLVGIFSWRLASRVAIVGIAYWLFGLLWNLINK